MSKFKLVSTIALASVIALMSSSVYSNGNGKGRGNSDNPVVYVYSQNLFYDTIVLGDLPFNETMNFQELEPGMGPTGLQTEFGPRDTEYYGGRWWIDLNDNGVMDDMDKYFLCPLLGPGRTVQ